MKIKNNIKIINYIIQMVTPQSMLATRMDDYHALSDKWCLWAHFPHDTDWGINSYKNIYTFNYVEETIAVIETLPDVLVKNCMMFLMREGVKPIWEDPQNRNGGCFSYKVSNKHVYNVWKELSYVLVGGTLSNNDAFVANVTGITISPKKNFCIIKIWMNTCEYQNPKIITSDIVNLSSHGSLFKKHVPEY